MNELHVCLQKGLVPTLEKNLKKFILQNYFILSNDDKNNIRTIIDFRKLC